MACNDDFGRNVLDACRRVDIRVPDEVAVIGVDNDEIQCELSCPPLTSVNINPSKSVMRRLLCLDGLCPEPQYLQNRYCWPRKA